MEEQGAPDESRAQPTHEAAGPGDDGAEGETQAPASLVDQVIERTDGVPLQSIVGYSAPEVEENYARALALCQDLKLTTELFPILYGLFRYYMLQAKYAKGARLATSSSRGGSTGEADFVVAVHRAVAGPLVYQGEYAAALPHLDKVLSIPATAEVRAKVNCYDVVDPELRVHGIENLRIADASIMPNVTSGSTNAPTVMIGEKAADLRRSRARWTLTSGWIDR